MSGAIDEDVRGIRARLRWAIWRAKRGGVGLLELERRAGLSRGELRQIQRKGCARVPVAKFRRIAEVLGVRVAWLVLGDGPVWWFVTAPGHDGRQSIISARTIDIAEARRWMCGAVGREAGRKLVALRPPWRRIGPAPRGFAPRRDPSASPASDATRCPAA